MFDEGEYKAQAGFWYPAYTLAHRDEDTEVYEGRLSVTKNWVQFRYADTEIEFSFSADRDPDNQTWYFRYDDEEGESLENPIEGEFHLKVVPGTEEAPEFYGYWREPHDWGFWYLKVSGQ